MPSTTIEFRAGSRGVVDDTTRDCSFGSSSHGAAGVLA